ncbi:MAG: ADP-ribosylglycohydrolase family protein [Promethearchaeota archaeon]
MKINYLDKFKGSLMGVGIGDTLGHPFEGILREEIQSKFDNFENYIENHRKLFKTYTDDTQLTLHTAQALIRGNGFNLNNFINEFILWLDDPPIGPGYGCLSAINKLKYGIEWKEAASNSGGNGTIMRIAPIGLFYCRDLEGLIKASKISSEITHSHPAASAGAILIARAISYLIFQEPKIGFSINDFFNVIISSISGSQDRHWKEFSKVLTKVKNNLHLSIDAGLIKFSQAGVKSPYFIEDYIGKAFVHPFAMSTVACSIFIFLKRLNSFKDCIFELSTAGGDSDTVGAIGGSLAGAYHGLENIPDELVKLVRNNKRIMKIGEELCITFLNRYLIKKPF